MGLKTTLWFYFVLLAASLYLQHPTPLAIAP